MGKSPDRSEGYKISARQWGAKRPFLLGKFGKIRVNNLKMDKKRFFQLIQNHLLC